MRLLIDLRDNFRLCLLAAIGLVFIMSCNRLSKEVPKPKGPNILFIVTDDQSALTLNEYGNQICKTPNIEFIDMDSIYYR